MNAENHGKRNLIMLGAGALTLTAITTCVSLWMYHSSGDIYLDRSRPGFLPDEEEAKEEQSNDNNYTFSENGVLNEEELTKYLEQLENYIERIKTLENPYSDAPLSDESLGITAMPADDESQED